MTRKSVVFIHPDLGIGGAERLVIDAAVGLQSDGHKVTIFTSHCDKSHCFQEAKDGTLDVRVRGNVVLPFSGAFSILFAILRQLILTIRTCILSNEMSSLNPDVLIVDQLSACIPLFRWALPKTKVIFYGHFPDLLLAKKGQGLVKYAKQLYRLPFDALEEWSSSTADVIVVNSKFTRSVFKSTFKRMRQMNLKVIYPGVDTDYAKDSAGPIWPNKKTLLSINRFEGKKNLGLAIKAFAGLDADRSRAQLVLAGGFDPRNAENHTTHKALQSLADSLKLQHETVSGEEAAALAQRDVDVLFLLSVPDELKRRLLGEASLLIYTPENEHFGIVPLEAMLAEVPVLATNTGGPLETIYDGRNGWLRSPNRIDQWTEVMRKPLIPSSAATLQQMGIRGRERVVDEFSRTKMVARFDEVIQALCASNSPRPIIVPAWMAYVTLAVLFAVTAAAIWNMVLHT
ncbi:glycosyltransferase family 4 protein [Piedraia hortae CBS 480.64]|uniref:Alpha-1,3/1,6-mannosyltransferase ALG2 n=1 Tax=Piedraia hortae CBS 480.64 TaxID=1314780 RepID=A0A6A7C2R8_9PEZI|nr:glycosyltransferase family 4 protein [Piedraia hortae CBS 480.64]